MIPAISGEMNQLATITTTPAGVQKTAVVAVDVTVTAPQHSKA
jgi:hypothetical protein